MTNPSKAAAPAALSLLAVATLSACGGTTIDSGKAAAFVKSHYTGPEALARVTCPKNVRAKKGTQFDCTLIGVRGDRATATVHIISNDGKVEIGPGDLHPSV